MYNILITEKRIQNKAILKWEENDIKFNESYRYYYEIFELHFKTTKELKFHWLQVLHRILPTNYYLYKLKTIDSPKCSFFKQESETISHPFVECQLVNEH